MKNLKKWIIEKNIIFWLILALLLLGNGYEILYPSSPEDMYENCISYSDRMATCK